MLRVVLACAVLGATVGFTASQLLPTSHADAMAMAAALVPAGVDAPPPDEIDFPFWYGGRYQATQSFVGGARDREHLVQVLREQMDLEGWRVIGVDPLPGATLVTAVQDDLEVLVHARHLPPTEPVEAVIKVMYLYDPPTLAMVLVGAASGTAAALMGLGRRGARGPGPSSAASEPEATQA